MEEFVIVKRAVKGRIRMELRIREVDKGGAAKVTNTREAGPFGKLRGLVFIVRSVSLSNWPLLVAQGPVKSRQSGVWRSRGKIMFPPITVILCESREFRNTSSKEKADPSSAVLTLTHISFRAGCFSDG